jgi:hypothetical protein
MIILPGRSKRTRPIGPAYVPLVHDIEKIKEIFMAKGTSIGKPDAGNAKKNAATKPATDAKAGPKKRGRPAKAK